MIIGLASPRVASSVDEAVARVETLMADAAARGAAIVCFPEAYVPGLRGLDFEVPPFDRTDYERAVVHVARVAARVRIATILGIEEPADGGPRIAAVVIDSLGNVIGTQTKNQLDPSEEPRYAPGRTRRMFEVNGGRFGIAICHEGFRYPETVRWAAARGAQIVFHPHCTGSDRSGVRPEQWGSPDGAYYEKAMMCRALENTVYFASVNYAFRFQESATTLISPSGKPIAHLPYGEEGVLVHDIDLGAATGLLAKRLAPERYEES